MNLKHTLRTLLTLAIAGGAFANVDASQFIDPNGFVYDLDENTSTAKLTLVIPPAAAMADIDLPATIEANGSTFTLTAIGDRAFYGNRTVTNITGGGNINAIGQYAFYGCTALTSFDVSENLETIDDMAFYSCSKLEGFRLNEGLTRIGNFAFWENKLMENANIPAGVTAIGENPFGLCQKMTQITVADGNSNFTSVDGVLFDKDVTKLISYPNGNYLNFNYTVPSTVKVIGSNSFYGNVSIMGVILPEGLEEIGGGAFRQCQLMTVEIPSTVKKIGSMVFLLNSNLASFTVAEGNPEYKSANGQLLSADGKHLIAGAVSNTQLTIPDGVEAIDDYAFFKFTKLKGVSLPSSVKTIGQSAFYSCSGITEFDFGEGLEVIGDQAFQLCTKLAKVTLPATMREIGFQAFVTCNALETLELNEGLVSIGSKAFMTLPMLKSVVLPGTLDTMGEAAFYMCPSLSEVVVSEGVTNLGNSCFNSCMSLTSVELPSTLKTIGNDAFNYCGIQNIELPEGLEIIGDASFSSCQLQEVVLPESVRSIGMLAFSNNYPLKSFAAGSSLETIGDNAMANCVQLAEIELNEGLVSIGVSAFSYCDALSSLTIPSTVTTLGKYFLNGASSLTKLVNNAAEPQVLTEEIFNTSIFNGYEVVELLVPADSKKLYENAAVWNQFALITEDIPDNVTTCIESKAIDSIYDLNGCRRNALSPGVNIIRYNDGTTGKITIK